ncbi:hypothetical protein FG386_002181 [Cryptosporidium ryanae]|uniref:uncharacterized protein n=1 Tax=Cryptosporidium ryanae TaxID=515981 RepID=UPI003519EB6B|nr:hypothetical protein FG386_002181 [Cryptosporidium ryanae]
MDFGTKKEIRRILYNPLLDLLRVVESWSKFRVEFKKLVHNYVVLKTELIYVTQKSFIPLNMFGLNENYINKSVSNLNNRLKASEYEIMKKLCYFENIIKDVYSIENTFSDIVSNTIIGEVLYRGMIGNETSVSVDIVMDFITSLKDCIEADFKVQGHIIKLIEDLKGYHTRNIQCCLGFFQSSPYGDHLEKEESFSSIKKAIREFITQ